MNRKFQQEKNDKRKSANYSLIYISALISFILTISATNWLPERFLRDSLYYQSRFLSGVSGREDSFNVVVRFYSALGLNTKPYLVGAFQWVLCSFALILIENRSPGCFHKKITTMYVIVYLFLIPVFCGVYTKEILIILFMIFLIRIADVKVTFTFQVFASLWIIGLTFRPYYFLIAIFTLLYSTILPRIRYRKVIWGLPIIFASILTTFEALTSKILDLTGRNILNVRTDLLVNSQIVANSQIHQAPLTTNFFNNFFVYARVFRQMVFPVDRLGFSLYSFISIFGAIYISVSLLLSSNPKPNPKFRPSNILHSLLAAYFTMALIFEPDLGSYTRHTFPYLLLIILLQTETMTNYSKQTESGNTFTATS